MARSVHLAGMASCPSLCRPRDIGRAALTEVKACPLRGKGTLLPRPAPSTSRSRNQQVAARRGRWPRWRRPSGFSPTSTPSGRECRRAGLTPIGSDHSPYTQAQKEEITFIQSPFGAPGVETMLPVLYSEGVATGRITFERLVQIMSENPARVLGLYPRKGTLQVGSDADLAVIDPEGETLVRGKDQHTNSDYSLLEGRTLKGRIEMSMVRGEVVCTGRCCLSKNKVSGNSSPASGQGGELLFSMAR